jgi:hypothetical protein
MPRWLHRQRLQLQRHQRVFGQQRRLRLERTVHQHRGLFQGRPPIFFSLFCPPREELIDRTSISCASGTICVCVCEPDSSSFRMWQFSGLMNCAFMVMRPAGRRGQFRHLTRRAERRGCEIDAWFMAPAVDAVAHSLEILLPLARIMQICVWRGIKIIGANSERYAKQDYQIFNIPFSSGTPGERRWKWIMLLLLSIPMRTWLRFNQIVISRGASANEIALYLWAWSM